MAYPAFPAWFYGPKGESNIFNNEADVPKGWKDHPSKHKGHDAATEQSRVTSAKTDEDARDQAGAGQSTNGQVQASHVAGKDTTETGDLDTDGHPWNPDLHAATKSKTNDGRWRMKVGVSRPDPAPGYPKPAGDAIDL